MYGVIRKIRHFNLPFDCQLDLFEKVVMPVLLYGCEVWGYKNIEIIERIHLKFLKHILNFKKNVLHHIWFMEKPEGSRYLVISILEWLHTGQNCFPVQKINLFIFCTNTC